MSRRSTAMFKMALSALHYTGADGLMAPLTRGVGVIFTLHNVVPQRPGRFEPNRILKITPEFLETAITQVQATGFDVVSLDEAHYRLCEGEHSRPFACFTFDDGYRDNYLHAYPVFQKHQLPFAVYVPTDYPDGKGELWWLALERAIALLDGLGVNMDGQIRNFKCATPDEKVAAYHHIYWWLRSIPERDAREAVREICRSSGIDHAELCGELIMSWDEIRQMARDPLVTIGAHTRSHLALAKLTAAEARQEMWDSVVRLERELGQPCRHFSFPYGDETSAGEREFALAKEMGMKTAVTTRKSLVHAEHLNKLTGLPRLSLNGDYQHSRYLKVLLSGVPFALWRMVRQVTPVS
ncbi:MAG: polysaccharide deacetylase family protein [Pseudomonadota bacterium]